MKTVAELEEQLAEAKKLAREEKEAARKLALKKLDPAERKRLEGLDPVLSVRVPRDLLDTAKRRAKEQDCSLGSVVRNALREHLK